MNKQADSNQFYANTRVSQSQLAKFVCVFLGSYREKNSLRRGLSSCTPTEVQGV